MKAKQKPGVVFQPEVHRKLQRGIAKMVNAISPTLGPLASGVAVDRLNSSNHVPELLDDGGVIARRIIELPDRDEDMGAMLVRSMLIRQHEHVGDGTATAAVLFKAIFDAGLCHITAGGNAMQLRRHLEKTIPHIFEELDRMVFQLEGEHALTQMARSVCNDAAMSALMGEAFDLIGEFGRLDIREDYGRVLRREYVEGTYFHTGLLSRTHLPEDSTAKVTFENPSIFLCDFEIEDHRELFPVLQAANAANVDEFIIVARSLSEKAISLLVTHNNMNKFKIAAIKLPGMNPDDRMIALDDLARLTGATPYIKITGNTLETVTAKDFGKARRVWANMRSFGLVGGGGNPGKLRQHIRTLRSHYYKMQDKDDRKKLQERIGNLLGGAITLWVGGFTETEINAHKSLANRTALAVRASIQEGVVPGGGIALLNCRTALQKRQSYLQDTDERAAYRILIEALAAPSRVIFQNAGYDPSEVMAKLYHECANVGFDVMANKVVNMCESGILDSVLVLKASLRNAISTAAMALTIDSLVHLARPEMIGKSE
jgi:chaperonin GroEL